MERLVRGLDAGRGKVHDASIRRNVGTGLLVLKCEKPLGNFETTIMTVAFRCMDCDKFVSLDLHGNCAFCGNPDARVVDPFKPLTFFKKSPWLLATAVLFGVGLTIWAMRQAE